MRQRNPRITALSTAAMAGVGAVALFAAASTGPAAASEPEPTTEAAPTAAPSVEPAPETDSIVPIAPKRVFESRTTEGEGTFDDLQEGEGIREAGSETVIQISGRDVVPDDAKAVNLNVTAAFAEEAGYLTVYACGDEQPTESSNVNYLSGDVSANAVVSGLSEDGTVCVYTGVGNTDLAVDVNGYVPATSGVEAIFPTRVLDTATPVEPGAPAVVDLAEVEEVPDDAKAVFLNVTAAFAEETGNLVVYPCDEGKPENSSSVNYYVGDASPNAVLAKIDADNTVCVEPNVGATNVKVDVNGYVPAISDITPLSPRRLYNSLTDENQVTVDGEQLGGGIVPAGSVTEVDVAGRDEIPEDIATAFLNVTSANGAEDGYFTVVPCDVEIVDGDLPNELGSNVNYFAGEASANAVTAEVNDDGNVCIYNKSEADVIVDIVGFAGSMTYPPAPDYPPAPEAVS